MRRVCRPDRCAPDTRDDCHASTRPRRSVSDHRDVRRTHVDAEDAAGIVLELEHDRPAPTARLADARLGDQRRGEQIAHDLRDRRSGESARRAISAREIDAASQIMPQYGVRERWRAPHRRATRSRRYECESGIAGSPGGESPPTGVVTCASSTLSTYTVFGSPEIINWARCALVVRPVNAVSGISRVTQPPVARAGVVAAVERDLVFHVIATAERAVGAEIDQLDLEGRRRGGRVRRPDVHPEVRHRGGVDRRRGELDAGEDEVACSFLVSLPATCTSARSALSQSADQVSTGTLV